MSEFPEKKIRKFLDNKISQLNDMIADFDYLLTELETDFYRVAIFGSARIDSSSPFYIQVQDLACALAKRNIDIVTGGGPGLMEAANRGAKMGGSHSRSFGLSIKLPYEDDSNQHLDVKRAHRRFSSRLEEFMRISHAVVVTPGGIGTMLELFYTWQLMQVNHIKPRPFLLWGKDMWKGLLKWMHSEVLGKNLMSESDYFMLTLVDSVDEILEILEPEAEKFHLARKLP